MHKVINLKNDQIYRHTVQYNDALDYLKKLRESNDPNSTQIYTRARAADVRETICDLVIQGKLDIIDLKIIAARDCSPMPSSRKVACQIKITHTTVLRRLHHIKSLIIKALPTVTPA